MVLWKVRCIITNVVVHSTCLFSAYIYKKCPHFKILEEIFGDKTNVVPPFLRDNLEQNGVVCDPRTLAHNDENLVDIDLIDNDANTVNNDSTMNDGQEQNSFVGEQEEEENPQPPQAIPPHAIPPQATPPQAILPQALPSQIIPSTSQSIPTSHVARFRNALSALPSSANGFTPKSNNRANAAEVIARALTQRAEAIREKLQQDSIWKEQEMEINREKLRLEREIRESEIELKWEEIHSNKRIRLAEIEAMSGRGGET